MAVRVKAILENHYPFEKRLELPSVLEKATESLGKFLLQLGFEKKDLKDFSWHWMWNSEYYPPFEQWLAGKNIELYWPDPTGLYCNIGSP